VVIWPGLSVSGRRGIGLGESVGTDHVFQGGREPQPSRERVDVLAVKQSAARRVGALVELEGDAHRLGLVHTGQHRSRGGRWRHGATVVFWCHKGRAAGPGAAERSAAGSWSRELMESF
jgi:hypothetical protein